MRGNEAREGNGGGLAVDDGGVVRWAFRDFFTRAQYVLCRTAVV